MWSISLFCPVPLVPNHYRLQINRRQCSLSKTWTTTSWSLPRCTGYVIRKRNFDKSLGSFKKNFPFMASFHLLSKLFTQGEETGPPIANNYICTYNSTTPNSTTTNCSNDQRPKSLHSAVDADKFKQDKSAWLSGVYRELETFKCIMNIYLSYLTNSGIFTYGFNINHLSSFIWQTCFWKIEIYVSVFKMAILNNQEYREFKITR